MVNRSDSMTRPQITHQIAGEANENVLARFSRAYSFPAALALKMN